MDIFPKAPMKIGIVGAGFSGTALTAMLHRLNETPIEIILFEKSGKFGAGPAYSTPFSHHLLNVRTQDMSAFEDVPTHFMDWLLSQEKHHAHFVKDIPLSQQFVPRLLYHDYLQHLLASVQQDAAKTSVTLESEEVIDIEYVNSQAKLYLKNAKKIVVDKVILALGNNPPATFPFPVSADIQCIENPWDYTSVNHIAKNDPVLIVGTGLSMIDAVLTLHYQQHQGRIYAVSRHGLLPLPHGAIPPSFQWENDALAECVPFTKQLRVICQSHMNQGGDWRSVINAVRLQVPRMWEKAHLKDKKRFLRHILPYWNIHRHRVHTEIMNVLSGLSQKGQLHIFSGRIIEAKQQKAKIKLRHSHEVTELPVNAIINCMGPSQHMKSEHQPLIKALLQRGIASLDPLHLGFSVAHSGALQDTLGNTSSTFYTLGAPSRGYSWETTAVPEIRRQIFELSRHLLAKK